MICTPIGIGSSGTGTATTGSPMKEIGWVWMPILAAPESSTPSSRNVACPSFGAVQGGCRCDDHVDGFEQLQYLGAVPAAEFFARGRPAAPGSSRRQQPVAHRAGSKSFGAVAGDQRCSDAPSAVEMT